MQTITTKLSAVRPFAADWSDNDIRALIHGTGGSPRRAKRLLKSDPQGALKLAKAFAKDIKAGTAFVTAVKAAAERFAESYAPQHVEEDDAAAEGEDEQGAEDDELLAKLAAATA